MEIVVDSRHLDCEIKALGSGSQAGATLDKLRNPIRNNVFTVEEMMRLKLVGRIIDEAQFKNEFEKTLVEYSNLPPESLKLSKELIRSNIKGTG